MKLKASLLVYICIYFFKRLLFLTEYILIYIYFYFRKINRRRIMWVSGINLWQSVKSKIHKYKKKKKQITIWQKLFYPAAESMNKSHMVWFFFFYFIITANSNGSRTWRSAMGLNPVCSFAVRAHDLLAGQVCLNLWISSVDNSPGGKESRKKM